MIKSINNFLKRKKMIKQFQAYVVTDKKKNESFLSGGKKFEAYSKAKVFYIRRDAQAAVDYLNAGNENGFAEVCRVKGVTNDMINNSQFTHKVVAKAIKGGARL